MAEMCSTAISLQRQQSALLLLKIMQPAAYRYQPVIIQPHIMDSNSSHQKGVFSLLWRVTQCDYDLRLFEELHQKNKRRLPMEVFVPLKARFHISTRFLPLLTLIQFAK